MILPEVQNDQPDAFFDLFDFEKKFAESPLELFCAIISDLRYLASERADRFIANV